MLASSRHSTKNVSKTKNGFGGTNIVKVPEVSDFFIGYATMSGMIS